jgi:hypothetical protein
MRRPKVTAGTRSPPVSSLHSSDNKLLASREIGGNCLIVWVLTALLTLTAPCVDAINTVGVSAGRIPSRRVYAAFVSTSAGSERKTS